MIKYNPKSWVALIFALNKSDTLRILWKELIYMAVFTAAIAYLAIHHFKPKIDLTELKTAYSLIGFVISLLLVFRTNTAYDRWWEGRKQWGALVNDCRNLAIKIRSFGKTEEDRLFFTRMISNFPLALKEHLRNSKELEILELTAEERKILEEKEHVPLEISAMLSDRVKKLKDEATVSQEEALILDRNLNALMDVCGACERIKNTPIPFSYSLFLKKFIFVYVITLPLAFVTTFGYYSVLIACFFFYVLVSMEVLAEEIEDPFGKDDNDLPTDELAEKIKKSVGEVLLR
ncbi:MAG: hypothetical protein EP338_05795 [Bacteroidetes bacterium]|nr:MAG: hypothetical protein EP338_05795 [Bacteroidota bacterium]